MIRKAQIRFICITVTILFAVFAVFFGITQFFLTRANNRAFATSLDEIERIKNPNDNEIIITVSGDGSYEIIPHLNSFSEDTVKKLIESVENEKAENPERQSFYAKDGNLYFKAHKNAFNQTVIVAADYTETVNEIKSNTFAVLILLIVIYFILALIVWLSSYKIFQPIKDTFYNQKRFISDASHELKTPVAVISANADVLKTTGEDNKYLKSIKTQTERLSGLVSDMLTLSRLDENENKTIRSEFSLSDEVNETVLPFEALAFEEGKILLTEVPPDILYLGDKDDVNKLLNILLDNALKYSVKGGTVKVTLKKDGNKISLSVFNSGSEVASEDSYKIFERFYRGDSSRSRETGGSGLGLSIAKSIAQKNKWKISASSVKGVSMTINVIM